MVRQCSTLLVIAAALFAPASSRFLDKSSDGSLAAPALSADIKHVLLGTRASSEGSDEDEFTQGCLSVTKAIVAENDGSKKKVASQLWLVCSGLQLPLDVEVCEQYRSTLLGHLHRDSSWNLMGMDFPLFCQGMDKVVAKHKADVAAMATGGKASDEEAPPKKEDEKGPAGLDQKAPAGLEPAL